MRISYRNEWRNASSRVFDITLISASICRVNALYFEFGILGFCVAVRA